MGFFDKLGDIWKDFNPFKGENWKATGDAFSSAAHSTGALATNHSLWGALATMALTPFRDDTSWQDTKKAFGDFWNDSYNAGTKAAAGVFSAPVLKQTAESYLWAQNELVKRPQGMGALMWGDASRYRDASRFFDGNNWRQAYNDTRQVSMGQAFTYAMKTGEFLTTDHDPNNFDADPRTEAGRAKYVGPNADPTLKRMSGAVDFYADAVEDPLVVVGKVSKVAKLAAISKPMRAGEGLEAARTAYSQSSRWEAVKNLARNPDTTYEKFHNTVFRDKAQGSVASSIIYDLARIQDKDLAWAASDNAILAAHGDAPALARLRVQAPDVAQALARDHAAPEIRDAAANVGNGQPARGAAELYDKVLDGDIAAKVADEVPWYQTQKGIEEGTGRWGELQPAPGAGVLVGENQPRVSFTGGLKAGIHEAMVSKMRWAVGGVSPRDFLPTATYTQLVSTTSRNSVQDFMANTERATALDPAVRNQFVEQYARASTPASREAIIEDFEGTAFTAHAKARGFTEEQARAMLPYINQARRARATLFDTSRRQMAGDLRRMAEDQLQQDQPKRAALLSQSAVDYDNAVKAGQQPAEHIHILDEDGNAVHFATKYSFPSEGAVLTDEGGRMMPMMDFRTLDAALRWAQKGPLKADGSLGGYTALNAMMGLADATGHVWKATTLLRPGYMWRVLSDEVLRRIATLGSASFVQNTAEGLVRGTQNTAGRAAILGDVAKSLITKREMPTPNMARAAEPAENVNQIIRPGETEASWPGARVSPDGKEVQYQNMQDMFANGQVGIREWTNQVLKEADKGTPLHPDFAGFVGRYKQGLSTRDELHRDMADWANWRAGQDTYRQPGWQANLVTDARNTPRETIITDPYTGSRLARPNLDNMEITATDRSALPFGFSPSHQKVYDFVHRNMDALKRPDSMLAVKVEKDQLVLSVVRSTDAEVGKFIPGAERKRLTFFGVEGSKPRWKKDSTTQAHTVTLADGTKVTHGGAFEGAEGGLFRGLASSRGAQGSAYADYVSSIEHQKILTQAGEGMQQLKATDRGYDAQWSETVNGSMAADPVARQFLEGRSVDDVARWAQESTKGRQWVAKLGAHQPLYMERIYTIAQMVDKYAPMVANQQAGSQALRDSILARRATVDDLAALHGNDRLAMPTIHGAEADVAFGGKVTDWLNKSADKIFKHLGDLPADAASRFPFFTEAYNRQMQQLIRASGDELGRQGLAISVNDVYKIQRMARERALWDVRKYLYDSAAKLDLANAFRLVVPFGQAVGDSYLKWGKIIQEKPWTIGNLFKLYTAPDRAGLTQDDKGNHKVWRDGHFEWVHVNPATGEETVMPADYTPQGEYINIQLPEGFGPLPKGMKYTQSINKDTLNTFLNFVTAGPIAAVPASEFAMTHPAFGDNAIVRKVLLPFGPSDNTLKAALPGTVRYAWEAFTNQDGDTATGQSLAIYQAETLNWSQGLRADKPTFQEARDKAAQLRMMRFYSYFGGVASQIETPYQPYVDHYRMLQSIPRGPKDETADEQFYREMGPEFFIFTAKLTQNKLGIPSTVDSYNRLQKVNDLVAANPEIAGWLVGADGAGEFSRSVYEAYKREKIGPGSDQTIRSGMSLEESVNDVQKRQGWLEYGRMQDGIDADLIQRGLTKITQKGAEDLKARHDDFVNAHIFSDYAPNGQQLVSPWYDDFKSLDGAKTLRYMQGFLQAAQDGRIRGRDDTQGFLEYLSGREAVRQQMDIYGFKTLTNKKAASLHDQWDAYVADLKDRNLAFAAMYNRYLRRDDLTFDLQGNGLAGGGDSGVVG